MKIFLYDGWHMNVIFSPVGGVCEVNAMSVPPVTVKRISRKTVLSRGICSLLYLSLLASPACAQTMATEAPTAAAVCTTTEPLTEADREPEPRQAAAREAAVPQTDLSETEPVQTTSPETEPSETEPQQTMPPEAESSEQAAASDASEGRQSSDAKVFTVPLYFQTDYPDQRYGAGTVASTGSSITALAMVASALTGYDYLPDELADYFGGLENNNIARLETGSTILQLPWRKAENVRETFAALAEGDIAIVLMNGKSIFSDGDHFLVLAGLNQEGRILVNDPYAPNYDHWLLKNGFANGFEEGDLIAGYSGGWIYDVSAMPENPERYTEPEPTEPSRYSGITLTAEEEDLLARLIYLEAAGEPAEGQQAIAEVVLNRMASDAFPDTLKGVLFAEGQFPPAARLDQAKPNQTQYDAIEDALSGPYVLPMDVVHYSTFAVTDLVWGTIGDHIFSYGV